MKTVACMNSCVLSSLEQLFKEHLFVVIAAGVFGALLGFVAEGSVGVPFGLGIGMLLAVLYGYIPRVTDCVGSCRIQ